MNWRLHTCLQKLVIDTYNQQEIFQNFVFICFTTAHQLKIIDTARSSKAAYTKKKTARQMKLTVTEITEWVAREKRNQKILRQLPPPQLAQRLESALNAIKQVIWPNNA